MLNCLFPPKVKKWLLRNKHNPDKITAPNVCCLTPCCSAAAGYLSSDVLDLMISGDCICLLMSSDVLDLMISGDCSR